ncbi:MAG: AMP-binding protein [Brachymonas sp.]
MSTSNAPDNRLSAAMPWLQHYPKGVPLSIDTSAWENLPAFVEENFKKYATSPLCHFMGKDYSYGQIDEQSRHFAAYLQSIGVQAGDRVAVMMVNVPQFLIAVAGILRMGAILVNVNPLYTAPELEHQLQDAGAKIVVVLENFAATVAKTLPQVPSVQQVVVATIGDMLGIKGPVVNFVLRHVRKQIPAFDIPQATSFKAAMAQGRKASYTPYRGQRHETAVLQYTGGTTGVAKGAALSHDNLIANTLQAEAWNIPVLQVKDGRTQFVNVAALPLYHIFAFTVSMMLTMRLGGSVVLIPNPRDIPAMLKELRRYRITALPAVNTLFNGLVNHPDFKTVDWSHLRVSLGGGMAVQSAVAEKWLDATGCPICEGYGLSETSPVLSCTPADTKVFSGTIGLPMPSTIMKCIDDEGHEVPMGSPGELVAQGPQVMQGYWQRPDETAKTMTADGFLKTGDIGFMDERGYFKIVDRKKDMILVSGFNVYPNEVEEAVSKMPGVLECAVVAVPNEHTGEAVKLFVVKKDPTLHEDTIRHYCRENLAGYKRPKHIEFRAELPKTPVGKILRRVLRDNDPLVQAQAKKV